MINNMKNNLYGWLFHYNYLTKTWAAFKREDVANYFNGNLEDVLTSKKHSTLVEIITKTNGDKDLIRKMLK